MSQPVQHQIRKSFAERRREFLEGCAAFRKEVRNDPEKWAEIKDELDDWEVVSADGLSPEDEEDMTEDADQQGEK